jgi:hypothetical protein
MDKNKLSIKDILWAIPMVAGVIIISILWFPVALYKSYKHSSNNK